MFSIHSSTWSYERIQGKTAFDFIIKLLWPQWNNVTKNFFKRFYYQNSKNNNNLKNVLNFECQNSFSPIAIFFELDIFETSYLLIIFWSKLYLNLINLGSRVECAERSVEIFILLVWIHWRDGQGLYLCGHTFARGCSHGQVSWTQIGFQSKIVSEPNFGVEHTVSF